ncbi:MAG: hypothetical protein K8R13_04040 [Methanococcoides sp.]|nr:hypothetical protein [Methanococcoides sp.]
MDSINSLSINVRDSNIHRNGFNSIIRGAVVVKSNQSLPLDDLIRANHDLIVKKVIKKARKDTSKTDISRYLRVGYIRISVFSEDFRIRKLINSGLIPELICTIERKRLNKIKQIDISGGTAEIKDNSRIVWNKNYLNETNASRD